MKTYVRFTVEPRPADRKTDVWIVRTAKVELGWISWYGPWRQFVFYPLPETVYSAGCLNEIERFIERQVEARRG